MTKPTPALEGRWRVVRASGDTMTGLLVLSGDPTAALGAATKQYVDALTAALTAADIAVTPVGAIAATDVQAAIEELDSEKQPLDADLTAIAALDNSDDNLIVGSATGWVVENGATLRTSIGVGTGDTVQLAKLGIGAALTDGLLHVISGSAGAVTAASSADELVVEGGGNTGISIVSPDDSPGSIYWASPSSNGGAVVSFDYDGANFLLATGKAGATMEFRVASNSPALFLYSNADIRLSAGTSALATNATGGFPGMPTMAGDASGTPTNENAGFAPFVYDTTNQELKIYDPVNDAWRAIATVAQ